MNFMFIQFFMSFFGNGLLIKMLQMNYSRSLSFAQNNGFLHVYKRSIKELQANISEMNVNFTIWLILFWKYLMQKKYLYFKAFPFSREERNHGIALIEAFVWKMIWCKLCAYVRCYSDRGYCGFISVGIPRHNTTTTKRFIHNRLLFERTLRIYTLMLSQ